MDYDYEPGNWHLCHMFLGKGLHISYWHRTCQKHILMTEYIRVYIKVDCQRNRVNMNRQVVNWIRDILNWVHKVKVDKDWRILLMLRKSNKLTVCKQYHFSKNSRCFVGEQERYGSPSNPVMHEHLGIWFRTLQTAFWPHVPGHGSRHFIFWQAKLLAQSESKTHSGRQPSYGLP